jgi:hypothetical protein
MRSDPEAGSFLPVVGQQRAANSEVGQDGIVGSKPKLDQLDIGDLRADITVRNHQRGSDLM